MNPRGKWEFYVHKLFEAEQNVKKAINSYRDFKDCLANYRYERQRTKKEKRTFDVSPNQLIDNIFAAQARVSFIHTKIEFYKTIALEGETIANKDKLASLEKNCAQLLSQYGQKLAYFCVNIMYFRWILTRNLKIT